MIIWFSLLIPALVAIIMVYFFHQKFVWWEIILPTLATLVVITIFKFSVETYLVSDTEYNNSLITRVRYYEPWETWVHKTCTRTRKCGKSTCTTVYDCSYCDHNGPKYIAYDMRGQEYNISYEHYQRLKTEWNNSTFVELNRSINHHWGCGRDGDAFESVWDGTVKHSESNVWEHSYENKTKVAHSAFHYQDINEDQAKAFGLYEYPGYYDTYKQRTLLGAFQKYVTNLDSLERNFQYLNGELNKSKEVKFYCLLFEDKPLSIAHQQESYWEGSNDNELVVCLGIDSHTKNLTWVKAFSWTRGKRTMIEIREELMEVGHLDNKLDQLYSVIKNSVEQYYTKKDFKEFNYLTIDPPVFEIVITYILALLVTLGVNYWCLTNEHEN